MHKTFLKKAPHRGERRRDKERHKRRSSFLHPKHAFFRLHPLFLIVGIWYACTGELFLFVLSALVAVQHECAHAFAAYKLGYKLNAIVLMPFGAVIDGDLHGISCKDEAYVALCGPLCNLITAVFFVALWWFAPTTYAFTDTAFYASLSIAIVNFLPAYPLDGGRIVHCLLTESFSKKGMNPQQAEGRARRICFAVTLLFACLFLLAFLLQCIQKRPNASLLAFGLFLFVGALGNTKKDAVYEKIDFSFLPSLQKGVEIRHVAILGDSSIKELFPFLTRGYFLVFEVYDRQGGFLFELPQNQLSTLFSIAKTPYDTLFSLWNRVKTSKS